MTARKSKGSVIIVGEGRKVTKNFCAPFGYLVANLTFLTKNKYSFPLFYCFG